MDGRDDYGSDFLAERSYEGKKPRWLRVILHLYPPLLFQQVILGQQIFVFIIYFDIVQKEILIMARINQPPNHTIPFPLPFSLSLSAEEHNPKPALHRLALMKDIREPSRA